MRAHWTRRVPSLEPTSALTNKLLCPLKNWTSPAWAAAQNLDKHVTCGACLQLARRTRISVVAGALSPSSRD